MRILIHIAQHGSLCMNHNSHKVVVLAFGTLGDVQPLALLSQSLHHATLAGSVQADVHFLSHAQHADYIKQLWSAQAFCPRPNFVAVTSLAHAPAHLRGSDADSVLRSQAQLHTCVQVCQDATLLVANLFALEAVHIAEALEVPLVVAHPYMMRNSMPPQFLRRLRCRAPSLYRRLHQSSSRLGVGLSDIEHWMWPLYTDMWSDFRGSLGLNELPNFDGRPAIPVLYLIDESILPRPDYLPEQVEFVGFVFPGNYGSPEAQRMEDVEAFLRLSSAPGGNLECHIPEPGPVLITFGTMVTLGALGPVSQAARQLALALKGVSTGRLERRFIVDAANNPEWAEALRSIFGAEAEQGGPVLVVTRPVPHMWLFPKLSVVVSHGGSGTVAAALRAGISQVVLPFMMDQPVWAERLHALGLAPPSVAVESVFPISTQDPMAVSATSPLFDAIEKASHPSMRLRAAGFGRRIRAREAMTLPHCLEAISAHLQGFAQHASAPSLSCEPPVPSGCELLTFENDEGHELSVMALKGSEAEVGFLYHEIFPPKADRSDWGYLKHGIKVRPGDVVLDVGANIGLFCLYLELFVMHNPNSLSYIVVEPAPLTCNALHWNLALYMGDDVPRSWNILQKAVGRTSGRASLCFYPHMPGNSTLTTAKRKLPQGINPKLQARLQDGATDVDTDVITISELLQHEKITTIGLLKVDVEGTEEEALCGVQADDWSRISQLVCEVHDCNGRRAAIDCLLHVQAGFSTVIWERPEWTRGLDVDNWIVYAHRWRA